jgi:hypothetical protein
MTATIPQFLLLLPSDSGMWPVYILMAISILYIVFRPMLRRKTDPLSKPLNMGLSQQRGVEREMNNLLVELSQMARQVTGQLDTRSAKLEVLMQQADQRIAELKRLSEPDRPAAGGDGNAAPAADGQPAEPGKSAPDPRHAEVYALADAGRSLTEIARQLDRPQGEVELILALRPRW